MEKELYTIFLDKRKEGKRVKSWWFNSKARELVKEKYPVKRPLLSYHTDDLRVFVDVIKYFSEERLAQLKSHQKLYVLLLRNSMQRLYKSAKEELLHLRIWITWTKRRCLFSCMTIEPMKRWC